MIYPWLYAMISPVVLSHSSIVVPLMNLSMVLGTLPAVLFSRGIWRERVGVAVNLIMHSTVHANYCLVAYYRSEQREREQVYSLPCLVEELVEK